MGSSNLNRPGWRIFAQLYSPIVWVTLSPNAPDLESMQNIPHISWFVNMSRSASTYLDQSMAWYFSTTYGIIVPRAGYVCCRTPAGFFTLGVVPICCVVRMSKKTAYQATEDRFSLMGAVAKGHDSQVAEQVFGYIETFAQYGFNRSRLFIREVSLQLVYIKAHGFWVKRLLNDAIGDKKNSTHCRGKSWE